MVSRRQILTATAVAAGAAVLPGGLAEAHGRNPFGLGVASGDPLVEPAAVRVVVRRAAVADRDHGHGDRAELGRGGPMRIGAHGERS